VDLKDRFWQIPLHEIFGAHGAIPVEGKAVWIALGIRKISSCLGPSNWTGDFTTFAYQNDKIVIGRTQQEHKEKLREAFRRLKKANLRINPDKCQFLKQELLYLGHRVTSQGISTDSDKVAAIALLQPPSTVRKLRQYLGVASW